MRRSLFAAISIWLTICAGCASDSRDEVVSPSAVAVREASDPEAVAPALRDPVLKVVNDREQKLYDIATRHYASFYEQNRSMCMAAPFLWEVNPHLADRYRVEPGAVVFVPSADDYVRWREANGRRFGQKSVFIADPAR